MEPYLWVKALKRFASNAHEAVDALFVIFNAGEIGLLKLALFLLTIYGAYRFAWIDHRPAAYASQQEILNNEGNGSPELNHGVSAPQEVPDLARRQPCLCDRPEGREKAVLPSGDEGIVRRNRVRSERRIHGPGVQDRGQEPCTGTDRVP